MTRFTRDLLIIAAAAAAIALLMPSNSPPCRNLDAGGIVSKLNCKEPAP